MRTLLQKLNTTPHKLRGDLTAGVTTAVVLIPQGMAYAMLAGLPPIHGLYAALVPLLFYALAGTSRQLAIGPVAADSLLVGVSIASVAPDADVPTVIATASLIALMVGVIQVLLGVFRAGMLVGFLSKPVVSGFLSGAAIIIALSQLSHFTGAPIPKATQLHSWLQGAVHLAEFRPLTLAIAVVASFLLIALRRRSKAIPRALIVVSLATLASWWFELESAGVAVVGAVPAGLPEFAVPRLDFAVAETLLPSAFGLALLGYLEAIGIGKGFARTHNHTIDDNRELIALGFSNIGTSFALGYPVTGGLSRSAVNAEAGAKTRFAGVVTAAVLALTLLLLTPLFHHLPLAVLAAIIITAVLRLVDIKTLRTLWHVRRSDAVLFVFTCLATLFIGMLQGIFFGTAASLVLFVFRSTRPHHAVLGRLPESTNYRNLKHFPNAKEVPGVKIWRFDASFYFANAAYFRDQVDALLVHRATEGEVDEGMQRVGGIVLDASGINDLDASGAEVLGDVLSRLESENVHVVFANVKGPVRAVLERSRLTARIGESEFFFSVHEAVERLAERMEEADAAR